MKILIVDDQPLFLELMTKYLGNLGYFDTHPCTSGEEALREIRKSEVPFDCFLLDIRMPGMDGITLCRAIRAEAGYDTTPILMVTALSDKAHVDQAFRNGANDYLTKPLDSIELGARIRMARALIEERQSALRLRDQMDQVERAENTLGFGDQITLDEGHNTLPFAGFENYLLRLGPLRFVTQAVVGLHVCNASQIFLQSSQSEFVDILREVSCAIAESLGDSRAMLAYAGAGDFCVVQTKSGRLVSEPEEAEVMVNDRIAQRLVVLETCALPMPRVQIGAAQSSGVFARVDPAEMVARAISSARGQGETAKAARYETEEYRHAG